MKIAIYLATIQLRIAEFDLWPLLHARRVMRAIARGIERADPSAQTVIVHDDRIVEADFAIMFGWLVPGGERPCYRLRERLVEAYAQDRDRLIAVETPLLARRVDTLRHQWWRMGCGGITRKANFLNQASPADRWERLQKLLRIRPAPYRQDGKHILLLGQKTGDASLFGLDIRQWLKEMIEDIHRLSDRPMVLRLHPREQVMQRSDFAGVTLSANHSLQDDLKDAWVVVSYSSGGSIDALLAGIPVIALSPHSLAYPVADHDLSKIANPSLADRSQWLADLAYAQWSNEELKNGTYWRHVMAHHPAYAVS